MFGLALAACGEDGATQATRALGAEPTAFDQGNAPADLALLGAVRRALVTDERLSFRAKNVVVVVHDGVVTLRGDVASAAERDALVARVASVPGIACLDDRVAARKD